MRPNGGCEPPNQRCARAPQPARDRRAVPVKSGFEPAHPAPNSDAFWWPVRVYYEDTDAAGVVYYANHLKFMERARTEWLRALGFDQIGLAAAHGVAFVVRSTAIDYFAPARMDDALEVTVELIRVGGGHIQLVQRVMRDKTLLATAIVKIACVAVRTMRPVRLPQPLATKIRTRT
jgi:acyl-CoA thioester hydrolase